VLVRFKAELGGFEADTTSTAGSLLNFRAARSKLHTACSPQFAHGWRRFLLKAFGAKIGRRVIVRPSARITYPWKVEIGDYSWVAALELSGVLPTMRI
jgi:acetyltransferase-like isoleucine patch superfamily enzyme